MTGRQRIGAGAIALTVAAAWGFGAFGVATTQLDDHVGPRAFPLGLAALLALLGLAMLIPAAVRPGWRRRSDPERDRTRPAVLRPAAMLALLAGFGAAAPLAGFPASMIALIFLVALVAGERSARRAAGVAAIGGLGLYLLFGLVLGADMPALPATWGL